MGSAGNEVKFAVVVQASTDDEKFLRLLVVQHSSSSMNVLPVLVVVI